MPNLYPNPSTCTSLAASSSSSSSPLSLWPYFMRKWHWSIFNKRCVCNHQIANRTCKLINISCIKGKNLWSYRTIIYSQSLHMHTILRMPPPTTSNVSGIPYTRYIYTRRHQGWERERAVVMQGIGMTWLTIVSQSWSRKMVQIFHIATTEEGIPRTNNFF